MTDYKNISLLAIPYLTFCAVLYHISYWDTFSLNGLSYISVSDILKSSVYPIISTSLFVFIGILTTGYIGNLTAHNEDVYNPSNIQKKTKLYILFEWLLVAIWIFLMFFVLSFEFKYKWFIWAFIASFPTSIILDEDKIFRSVISNPKHRTAFTNFIIFLPFLSVATGKYESQKIQTNSMYKFAIRTRINPNNNAILLDTLKYLGATDKNFIFTDLKNNTIFLVKSDKIDTLILMDRK